MWDAVLIARSGDMKHFEIQLKIKTMHLSDDNIYKNVLIQGVSK